MLFYCRSMIAKEIANRTVKIFDSTYELGNQYKEKRSLALFIDDAVNFYVKSLNEEDPYNKIAGSIARIEEKQNTNLGLLCEVLHQSGILNENGDVISKKA